MLDEYLHILLDPSHTLVEMTFIAVEFVILNVIWTFVKRRWNRHMHRDIAAGKHVKDK